MRYIQCGKNFLGSFCVANACVAMMIDLEPWYKFPFGIFTMQKLLPLQHTLWGPTPVASP